MAERPISQTVAFRQRVKEGQILRRPQTLAEEEKQELGVKSTALLRTLVETGSRFLQAEEMDMKRHGLSSMYLSPELNLPEAQGDFCIWVEKFIPSSLGTANPTGLDQLLGDPTVNAAIFLKIPEFERPQRMVSLDGVEPIGGELTCTRISTANDFFMTAEERAGKSPFNQLTAVDRAQGLADSLAEALQNVNQDLVLDGRKGHFVAVEDWRHGRQTLFVPHSENPNRVQP